MPRAPLALDVAGDVSEDGRQFSTEVAFPQPVLQWAGREADVEVLTRNQDGHLSFGVHSHYGHSALEICSQWSQSFGPAFYD